MEYTTSENVVDTRNVSGSTTTADETNAMPTKFWDWTDYVKCIVAIVGFVGNALVIIVYIKNRQTRSPTNELLAGLATADMMSSILMFPMVRSWDCIRTYVNIVFMWVTITISIFTLTVVSFERFVAIAYPTKYPVIFSRSSRMKIVTLIWTVAIALNIYQFFIWHKVNGICILIWPSVFYEKVSGIGVFLFQYVIPVAIMLFTNIAIVMKLRAERRELVAKNETGDGPAFTSLRAKEKVVEMLLVVVITFFICWTPEQLAHFGFTMGFVPQTFFYSTVYNCLVLLAFINSCINPFIYALKNPKIRTILWKVMLCKRDRVTPVIN